jgi:hypothetical protein
MVTLGALWLPILLSAVLVFVVSALVHMVFKYHNTDYHKLSNEEAVRATLRAGSPAPGQYVIPHCIGQDMNSPEVKQKYAEGPNALLYLTKPGPVSMGPMLGRWFLFILIVSFFIAYVACHALPPGAEYLKVFQIVGAVGFLAYAAGQVPAAIWMGKPWAVAWKEVFDGLLYGLVTAGTFGWLWPR